MQLGFQCDASLTPLKFLNQWYGRICPEYAEPADISSNGFPYDSMDKSPGSTPYDARTIRRTGNRTVKLSYPDEYCRNIYVTKTELGPKRDGGLRTSMTYVMERAWPFAIDAVPLQFGSASITKVTAQFYYSKHRIVYHDPTDLTNKELSGDFDDESFANFGLGSGRGG